MVSMSLGDVRIDADAVAAFVRDGGGPVTRDLMRRATNVQTGARALVRKRTRATERSITKRLDVRGGVPVAIIQATTEYAFFEHEGTSPHTIRPRSRKVLRFPGRGGVVFTTVVHHPGTTGSKFLAKALPLAGD